MHQQTNSIPSIKLNSLPYEQQRQYIAEVLFPRLDDEFGCDFLDFIFTSPIIVEMLREREREERIERRVKKWRTGVNQTLLSTNPSVRKLFNDACSIVSSERKTHKKI